MISLCFHQPLPVFHISPIGVSIRRYSIHQQCHSWFRSSPLKLSSCRQMLQAPAASPSQPPQFVHLHNSWEALHIQPANQSSSCPYTLWQSLPGWWMQNRNAPLATLPDVFGRHFLSVQWLHSVWGRVTLYRYQSFHMFWWLPQRDVCFHLAFRVQFGSRSPSLARHDFYPTVIAAAHLISDIHPTQASPFSATKFTARCFSHSWWRNPQPPLSLSHAYLPDLFQGKS